MFTIQAAGIQDIPFIQKLSGDIWPVAYGRILQPEQIRYMLDLMYSAEALRRQMEEGHSFLLGCLAGEPVAFASFSEPTPGRWKLHKLYLMPSLHGQGYGRKMLVHVMDAVKQKGASVLCLNVNRHNPAQLFYEQLGFTVTAEEDIDIGRGFFMNDYVMECKL